MLNGKRNGPVSAVSLILFGTQQHRNSTGTKSWVVWLVRIQRMVGVAGAAASINTAVITSSVTKLMVPYYYHYYYSSSYYCC